jgi:hypothetical protein
MKRLFSYIGVLVVIQACVPFVALAETGAQTPSCSANGYTVVFVNGIFDTEEQARVDKDKLEAVFIRSTKVNEPVNFQLAYNPSHLAGAGDLAETISQMLFAPISDLDLKTILRNIAAEDATQKLLIVGHSQGALYGNEAYDYIIQNGTSPSSVGVYAVASPATYVAGGGTYVTSSNDEIISGLTALAKTTGTPTPLPSNITTFFDSLLPHSNIYEKASASHSFAGAYLFSAGDRIVNDIQSELSQLKSTSSSATVGCFTPPPVTQAEIDARNKLVLGDAIADGVVQTGGDFKTAISEDINATVAFFNILVSPVVGLQNAQIQVASSTTAAANSPEATVKGFDVMKTLYGSSLDDQDVRDLLGSGSNQGSAVALAGVVEGTSTVLDTSTSTEATSTNATTTQPYVEPNFFDWTPGGGAASGPAAGDATVSDDAVEETAPVDATTTDTDDAASTTPAAPGTPLFTDNFDSFDGSGWTVPPAEWNSKSAFTFDDGADGSCVSGGCLVANGSIGGLGTMGTQADMYETEAAPAASGEFLIWGKARLGFRGAGAAVFLCEAGTSCDTKYGISLDMPTDDVWRPYAVAWRQGAASPDACILKGDSDLNDCNWWSLNWDKGAEVDGVDLVASVVRSDLGDNVWLDEMRALGSGSAALTVANTVVNNSGGGASAGDFKFTLHAGDSHTVLPNAPLAVPAGVYKIEEAPTVGYESAYGGGCDDNGYIVLAPGENKTCSVTTSDLPRLTPFRDNFDGDATGTPLAGQGGWTSSDGGMSGWSVVDYPWCEGVSCIESSVYGESAVILPGGAADSGELSFDAYVPSALRVGYPASVTLTDQRGTGGAGGLIIAADASETIRFADDHYNTLFGGVSLGAWHALKIDWFKTKTGCEEYISLDGGAAQDAGAVQCGVGGATFYNGVGSAGLYIDNVNIR